MVEARRLISAWAFRRCSICTWHPFPRGSGRRRAQKERKQGRPMETTQQHEMLASIQQGERPEVGPITDAQVMRLPVPMQRYLLSAGVVDLGIVAPALVI